MRDAMKRGKVVRGVSVAVFLLVLFLPAHSPADLYRWTDDDGVLHITDDLGRVPEEERAAVKVFKSRPPGKAGPDEVRPLTIERADDGRRRPELYGDQTLEWWVNTFRKKIGEVRKTESGLYTKKQFMEVFEGGRRFGQIYGEEEVAKYERFSQEVSDDESRLEEFEDELDELRRKATIYGVPREVRGE